jgi:hypothetical protein
VNDVLRTNSDNEGYFDSGSRTPLEWPVNADSRLLLDTMYRAIVCILPCICQAVGDLSNPLTDSRNSSYRRSVGVTVGISAQSWSVSVRFQVRFQVKVQVQVQVRFDVLNEEVEKCRDQFRSVQVRSGRGL